MNDTPNSKRCSQCAIVKPLSEFHSQRSEKCGVKSACKNCTGAYMRKYYQANRDRLCAARRNYRDSHGEEVRTADKKYREAHPEQRRVRDRAYRETHREERRASARKWQYAHREKYLADCKKRHLWRDHGMTFEMFELLLKAQGSVCAICGVPPKSGRLHVDHNHNTGKVRALLCAKCNQAIGLMRDDPDILRAAADYLESFQAEDGRLIKAAPRKVAG